MSDLPKYRLVLVDNTDPECTTELLAENYGLEVRYDLENALMVVAPRGSDEEALDQHFKDNLDYVRDLTDEVHAPWSAAFPHSSLFKGVSVHYGLDLTPDVMKQLSELAASVNDGFAELALFERREGTDTYISKDEFSGAQVNDANLVDWRQVAFADFPECTTENTQFDFTGTWEEGPVPAKIQSPETWLLPDQYDYRRAKARAETIGELENLLEQKLFTRSGAHPETVEILTQDYRLMRIDIDPYGYVSGVQLPRSDDFDYSWEPVISAEIVQRADGRWELLLGEPVEPGEEIPLVPDDYLHIEVPDPHVASRIFGPLLTEYQHRTGKSQPLWTGVPDMRLGLPAVEGQPGLGL